MTKRKKSKRLSACCRAEITYSDIASDFIGDDSKTMTVGTCYFICTKCNQPCNIYIPIRKVWKKNPVTKVIRSKREEKEIKLTKKEIEYYRLNEDF